MPPKIPPPTARELEVLELIVWKLLILNGADGGRGRNRTFNPRLHYDDPHRSKSANTLAAFRMHQQDPLTFNNALKVTWKSGDTSEARFTETQGLRGVSGTTRNRRQAQHLAVCDCHLPLAGEQPCVADSNHWLLKHVVRSSRHYEQSYEVHRQNGYRAEGYEVVAGVLQEEFLPDVQAVGDHADPDHRAAVEEAVHESLLDNQR